MPARYITHCRTTKADVSASTKEAKLKKLPPHIAKLAPKRSDFPDQEEYEEAKAFFLHRHKHLAKKT